MTSNPTDVKSLFDRWADAGRADSMAEHHGPAARPVFDRLPLEADSWFLDIGCGGGYAVRWAAERAPRGRAFGIDVSPRMIAAARRRCEDLTNVEWLCAPFPDEGALPEQQFSAIFSMEAFYYLPDLEAALARVRALLRPGGTFACVVDYYAENTASHSWRRDLGLPLRLLSARGWRLRFEEAGLEVVEQGRVRLPPEIASAEWKTRQGSLFTIGRRPA